jgi:hypothetical protein
MIFNLQEISEIFNCFHDADITSAAFDNKTLTMNIDFALKEKDPEFNFSFTVFLYECESVMFKTWPRMRNTLPRIIFDITAIFSASHWILEGNIKDDTLNIVCSQSNDELDFCGGELFILTKAARIFERNGKELTLDELNGESSQCWNALQADA